MKNILVVSLLAQLLVFDISIAGGWRTEGFISEKELSQLLQAQPEEVPEIFKIEGDENQPRSFALQVTGPDLFWPRDKQGNVIPLVENSSVNIFERLVVCFDARLGIDLKKTQKILAEIEQKLDGGVHIFTIQQRTLVDLTAKNIKDCSVVFTPGDWAKYPYSRLTPQVLKEKGIQAASPYALFNQYGAIPGEDTGLNVPIVMIRPDVVINQDEVAHFTQLDESGAIRLHIRPLLAHELGHLLGFVHSRRDMGFVAQNFNPELSVMSIDSLVSTPSDVQRRSQSVNAGEVWDFRQVSIYRNALWGHVKVTPNICVVDGEQWDIPLRSVKKTAVPMPVFANTERPVEVAANEKNLKITMRGAIHRHFEFGENRVFFIGVDLGQDDILSQMQVVRARVEDLGERWRVVVTVEMPRLSSKMGTRLRLSSGIATTRMAHKAQPVWLYSFTSYPIPMVLALTPEYCY